MKASLVALFCAFVPLALFGASGTAIPGGTHSTSFVINKPGAYYLAANRIMSDKAALAAIEIQASDVTLDLNGFTLSYVDSGGYNGGLAIGIFSLGTNVEVRNGSISTTPSWAVVGVQGAGFRVIDVRATDTQGIAVHGRGALVERCQVTNTRGRGITVGSQGGVIRNCQVSEAKDFSGTSGTGIVMSTSGRVVGCSISHTSDAAIRAEAFNFIEDNTVYMANQGATANVAAIMLSGGRNLLSRNSIQLARSVGIRVSQGVRANVLHENIVAQTIKVGATDGMAISSGDSSTIVRGNIGAANDGVLISGPYVDGGGNIGD